MVWQQICKCMHLFFLLSFSTVHTGWEHLVAAELPSPQQTLAWILVVPLSLSPSVPRTSMRLPVYALNHNDLGREAHSVEEPLPIRLTHTTHIYYMHAWSSHARVHSPFACQHSGRWGFASIQNTQSGRLYHTIKVSLRSLLMLLSSLSCEDTVFVE